ncbi:hypothetical protein ACO0LC_08635 [Undibacterium sp. JH2W]|uniref:hypothetical protein n=1 Tax=Undibacterium sp. JH2W TaxID=3413037 RepID=UPI003BF177D8
MPDEFRGSGLSKHIMRALEDHLLDQDVHVARLETGIRQPEHQACIFASVTPSGLLLAIIMKTP